MHSQLQQHCLPSQWQPHLNSPNSPPKYCALCTPTGRQCLNNYILSIHLEWSDPEEKKDLSKQQKEEEQEKEEDLNDTKQKQKEQELKSDKILKSDPETMSLWKTVIPKKIPNSLQIL